MAFATIDVTKGITGTIPVANGGTGLASGTTGQFLKFTGSTTVASAAVSAGITEADMWRVTSGFSSTTDPIANNWERVDDTGFNKIGTGMSQSSGIFTFPSTGIYKITFAVSVYKNGDDRTITKRVYTTINNNTYTELSSADTSVSGVQSNNTHTSGFNEIYFDVTDTSNCKIKFAYYTNNSSTYYTTSSYLLSHVAFIRMGDT